MLSKLRLPLLPSSLEIMTYLRKLRRKSQGSESAIIKKLEKVRSVSLFLH
jgi:hypothetical protein